MTTAYTSLLGLALPVTGELSGTWGDTVNNYITQYIDTSIAGALTVNADTTLTKTTGVALNSTSSQYAILIASGHSTNITITAPAASKEYLVINTSGTYTVTIRGAGPTTGVVLAANERALVAWNGTDFVKIGGTVSAVSVATANGLAGTSSGGLSPALTLSTTVSGVVKGNGTALSAATAGTDYVAPGTATTFTATQTFSGTSSTLAAVMGDSAEPVTVTATAATGTINYDTTTQSVLYYTTNASGNWVFNFRASSGTTLNSILSTGQAITVVFLATNGSTAYRPTSIQVDGTTTGVTTRWQGGSAPSAGNTNGVDAYTVTIIKTGSATFSVFAAQTLFA